MIKGAKVFINGNLTAEGLPQPYSSFQTTTSVPGGSGGFIIVKATEQN